jgi:hypothetical protein
LAYFIDIKGQADIHINSNDIPRIDETVILSPHTFDGQEEELHFRVAEVVHTLGRGFIKEIPIIMLEPI